MTATIDTPIITPPAGIDLADQVRIHMETLFPEDVDAGGWICARDSRDGTAVVVWRPTKERSTLLPGGARAVLVYRWHVSLQNAGFIVTPRTDMEVFGRPDEEADDGRARWMHITGWDPDRVVKPRTVQQLATELKQKVGVTPTHRVRLNAATVAELPDSGSRIRALLFQYRDDGTVDVDVNLDSTCQSWPNPPAWVLAIAEQHRSHGTGWDGDGWCEQEATA
ncbi:hypothetical protein [Streptomyces sp. enrichment culture]|uniref:hypothetical protein n=1 Tax=Streptomyces sp. enrichment culture TaxID=1795815 RepID=UPI003F5728B7